MSFSTALLTSADTPGLLLKDEIVDFLFTHLDQYGDKAADIKKAVEYALSPYPNEGGFVLLAREDQSIVGSVVVLKTGMSGYIPENILVYIAVDRNQRGKGVGKKLMEEALSRAKGDIALHVEPENPARYLYEKIGFTSKYMEMRYHKN